MDAIETIKKILDVVNKEFIEASDEEVRLLQNGEDPVDHPEVFIRAKEARKILDKVIEVVKGDL